MEGRLEPSVPFSSPVPGCQQTRCASKEALCKWLCKQCHSATTSNGDSQKVHLGPGCSLATCAKVATVRHHCLSIPRSYMMYHVVSQQIQ